MGPPVTVVEFALHLSPHLRDRDSVTAGDLEELGLPFFGGCQYCGATISAGNACFGSNGYLVGTCCARPGDALDMLAARVMWDGGDA